MTRIIRKENNPQVLQDSADKYYVSQEGKMKWFMIIDSVENEVVGIMPEFDERHAMIAFICKTGIMTDLEDYIVKEIEQ